MLLHKFKIYWMKKSGKAKALPAAPLPTALQFSEKCLSSKKVPILFSIDQPYWKNHSRSLQPTCHLALQFLFDPAYLAM